MLNKFKRILFSNELLIISLVVLIKYYFSPGVFNDPDEMWHIQAGYLIRKLGSIPYNDIWSFTSTQQWYNISWLWDIFSSYIHEFCGEQSLQIVTGALYGLLLCYLYRLFPSFGKFKDDTRNIVVTLVAMVLWEVMFFRPQIVSYFLTLFCYKLFLDSRKKYDWLIVLKFCIAVILWANVHGSVPIAFIILAAFIVEAYQIRNYRWLKTLVLTGFIGSMVLLINPLGYKLIYAILRTLNSVVYEKIIEWTSFKYGIWYGFSFFISVFLIVTNIRNNKVLLADKLLTYFWMFYSLASIRCFATFALLSSNYMAQSIDPLIKKGKIAYKAYYNPIVIILVFAILWFNHKLYPKTEDINNVVMAKKEIEYLAKHYPGIKILNHYNIGGYIIYFSNGKIKHFVDGRAGTAFSEELLSDYVVFFDNRPGWQEILNKYKIEGAIIPKSQFSKVDIETGFKSWYTLYEGDYGKVLLNPKYYKQKHGE